MNTTWMVVAVAFPFVGYAFLTIMDWVIYQICEIKKWHDFYVEYQNYEANLDLYDCPEFDLSDDIVI